MQDKKIKARKARTNHSIIIIYETNTMICRKRSNFLILVKTVTQGERFTTNPNMYRLTDISLVIQNRKLRRSSEERRCDDVRNPQLYLPTTRRRPNPARPFALVDSDEIAGTDFLAHGGEGGVWD
jgi:hypothetical protein